MKPRSRIIQYGFFTNEELSELPFQTRLLFIGLWTIADKAGRLEYRPKKLKAIIFPYDDANIDDMIHSLESYNFLYLDENREFIQITKWDKHQNPHWNETESEIDEFQQVTFKDSYKNLNRSQQVIRTKDKRRIEIEKKTKDEIPFEEIIEHLNYCANTSYRYKSKKTQTSIVARWGEGFRLIDFKYVHAVKIEEWMNTDMEKYIRPETLYSNKFEGYRQQKPKTATSNMPEWQKKNAELIIKNIKG